MFSIPGKCEIVTCTFPSETHKTYKLQNLLYKIVLYSSLMIIILVYYFVFKIENSIIKCLAFVISVLLKETSSVIIFHIS